MRENPDYVTLPGRSLADVIEDRGISQAELARRMGRPTKTISEIINGKAAITPETALQLEQTLGIPAKFWNARESNYRDFLARKDTRARLDKDIELAKKFPYSVMAKWGWVPVTSDWMERVDSLLRFFGVTALSRAYESINLGPGAIVYRSSTKHAVSEHAVAAWLRKGVLDAQLAEVEEYSRTKLLGVLPELRKLTLVQPGELVERLRRLLAQCGVALSITPSLPKAPINGATRWLTKDKAMIQMSIRYAYADIFWFSLFHEIGHLLLHGKSGGFVDLRGTDSEDFAKSEKEADAFASVNLISESHMEAILADIPESKKHSTDVVHRHAKRVGIHPGIIVGRLQHEGVIPHNYNTLRVRFKWVD